MLLVAASLWTYQPYLHTKTHICTHIETPDGNDFVPISNQLLIIPLENTTGCQNITIVGDRIVENDEDFSVEVNVTSPLVTLNGSNSTTITIIDDDGRFIFTENNFSVLVITYLHVCS